MSDSLSNFEFASALDGTFRTVGVKADRSCGDFFSLLRKKKVESCIQKIARQLNLPVRINISYIPENYKPNNTNKFHTSTLAKTDWTGHCSIK